MDIGFYIQRRMKIDMEHIYIYRESLIVGKGTHLSTLGGVPAQITFEELGIRGLACLLIRA
jgi:hypothetical protein